MDISFELLSSEGIYEAFEEFESLEEFLEMLELFLKFSNLSFFDISGRSKTIGLLDTVRRGVFEDWEITLGSVDKGGADILFRTLSPLVINGSTL